jgi:hypothetical protein
VRSRGATNRNVIASVNRYDAYVTWAERLEAAIHAAGCPRTIVLPFAFDRDRHFPPRSIDEGLGGTITFAGAWDRRREHLLTHLADFPLRIYGWGWNRIHYRSPLRGRIYPHNIYDEQLRRVVSSSLVSINILRAQNEGTHNMRTFEIPAMGGLMVTTRSAQQDAFFPEGQACLMYGDGPELRRTLQAIRAGDLDTQAIKSDALSRSAGNSYDDRARTLVDALTEAGLEGIPI